MKCCVFNLLIQSVSAAEMFPNSKGIVPVPKLFTVMDLEHDANKL